jgi:opacity protein-like surface antigen
VSATQQAQGSSSAKLTDLSIGTFGQLTPTRSPSTTYHLTSGTSDMQTTQGTSPSAGVLATMHQSFTPVFGYVVSLGYSRFSENYSKGLAFTPASSTTLPDATFSRGSIETNMYEVSVAYAIQGPRINRFSTFTQLGGGGLFFLPIQNQSQLREQTRPAIVFGAGVNYLLSDHISMRVEYRGLFYKNPDFAYYSNTEFPISKLFTATNEPAISIVYRFNP